jgi:hypothetical protein
MKIVPHHATRTTTAALIMCAQCRHEIDPFDQKIYVNRYDYAGHQEVYHRECIAKLHQHLGYEPRGLSASEPPSSGEAVTNNSEPSP